MGSFENLEGQVYGKLRVLPSFHRINKRIYWDCECSCVHKTVVRVRADILKRGESQSCGECNNNTYEFHEGYVKGYTHNGGKPRVFYIDREDFELVKDYRWLRNDEDYIVAYKEGTMILQHRLIMGSYTVIDDLEIDHSNHNRSDNREKNLRTCYCKENQWNRTKTNRTSMFKGISIDNRNGHYIASIRVQQNTVKGSFLDLKHAIIFRVQQEVAVQGEFRYKGEDDRIQEFCQMSLNEILQYDIKPFLLTSNKNVYQYDLDGNFIKRWDSTMQAARELGFNQQHIGACCRGIRKTHKGFKWSYQDERAQI